MMLAYNPVKDIPIPDEYFQSTRFDFDHPKYGSTESCKKLEDTVSGMKDISSIDSHNAWSWVLLLKNLMDQKYYATYLLSPELIDQKEIRGKKWIEPTYQSGAIDIWDMDTGLKVQDIANYEVLHFQKEKYRNILNQIRQYREIDENTHPNSITLTEFKTIFTKQSYQLIALIDALGENDIHCTRQNDANIFEELHSNSFFYTKAIRLILAQWHMYLAEWRIDDAIDVLEVIHRFHAKYFASSTTTLASWMLWIELLNKEYDFTEKIYALSNEVQKERLRNIYKDRINISDAEILSLQWEQYFFVHFLTGRSWDIRSMYIPYIFNGQDAYNRAIILSYWRALAMAKRDSEMLKKIELYISDNCTMFLSPVEMSLLGEKSCHTWKDDLTDFGFDLFYNPIGKNIVYSMSSPVISYYKRYNTVRIYQDYIRHDLLGIQE
jgi:hypothetical protein